MVLYNNLASALTRMWY